MDEQNQIKERKLRLLSLFVSFIAIYASIHKFFIPLALQFTQLKNTTYSEIQPTLVVPVLLGVLVTQPKRNMPAISFFCGTAITFALYEIYLTVIGVHLGWLAFSRLLSSVPLSVVAVVFLSKPKFGSIQKWAWLGTLAFAMIAKGNEWHRLNSVKLPPLVTKINEPARALPPNENMLCGAKELLIQSEVSSSSILRIEPCGLSPSVLQLETDTFEIQNQTEKPVNLHLLISDGGRTRTGWNILVRAREAIRSRPLQLKAGMAALLYSDSMPQVGIVAVIPKGNSQHWTFSRKPIAIKPVGGK